MESADKEIDHVCLAQGRFLLSTFAAHAERHIQAGEMREAHVRVEKAVISSQSYHD